MADMKLQIVGTFRDLISPQLAKVQKGLNALNASLATAAIKMGKDVKQSSQSAEKSMSGFESATAAAAGAMAGLAPAFSKTSSIVSATTKGFNSFKNALLNNTDVVMKQVENIKVLGQTFSESLSIKKPENLSRIMNEWTGLAQETMSDITSIFSGKNINIEKTAFGRFSQWTKTHLKDSLNQTGKLFKETFFSIIDGAKVAGAALIAFGGISIVNTNRQFQTLKATLNSVTNSAEEAEGAFAFIKDISKSIPGDVASITQSFIKLKALGLNPSRDALISYANTAAAMGKSLNQFVEAIADATTNEFERLKEFGIKARQEGDKVTFTFRGMSETVGKNAAEIEAYLRKIGNTTFLGAATKQMETFDGKLSNLKVSLQEFAERWDQETGMLDFFGRGLDALIGFTNSSSSMFLKIRLGFAAVGKSFADGWANIKNIGIVSSEKLAIAIQGIYQGYTNTIISYFNTIINGFVAMYNKATSLANKLPGVNLEQMTATQISPVDFTSDNLQNIDAANRELATTLAENKKHWDGYADYAMQIDQQYKESLNAGKQYETQLKKEEEQLNRNIKAEEERQKSAEKLKDRMMEIGGEFQNMFSTFFMDIMNGGDAFKNLAANFKNAVDRMVADALAANLVKALFGDITGSGTPGGFFGGGLQKAVVGLFGREHGGPVQRGMPYIVGEKRPELFVPNEDGTIVPNLNGVGGGTTNVTITAIDSRGVADFIEKNKFAFAGAVANVNNRYKMG